MNIQVRSPRLAVRAALIAVAVMAGTAAGSAGAAPTGPVASEWQAMSVTSIRPSTSQMVGSMRLTVEATCVMKPTSTETFVMALSHGTFVSGNVGVSTAPSTGAATVSGTLTVSPGTQTASFTLSSTGTAVHLQKTEKINITTVVVDATPQSSSGAADLEAGTAIDVSLAVATTTPEPVAAPSNSIEVATVRSNGKITASSVTTVMPWGTNEQAGNLTISLINDTGTTLTTSVLTLTINAVTATSTAVTRTQKWYTTPMVRATTATATATAPSGPTLKLHVSVANGKTGTVELTTVRYATATARGTIRVTPSWHTSLGGEVGAVTAAVNAAAPYAGYWEVAADGGIFSFGSAVFHGSIGGTRLNAPIVGMAEDQATGGYWEVASDGGVFSFDAPFYGSMGGRRLNAPIVGMAATPTGGGYWLVASDGGIFTFGNARFYGSMGGRHLDAPVSGMAATEDGGGYDLVGRTGGVFTFGDAGFDGSCSGEPGGSWVGIVVHRNTLAASSLVASNGAVGTVTSARIPCLLLDRRTPASATVVGIAVSPRAVWLVCRTGDIVTDGGGPSYGSMEGRHLNAPIVGMAVSFG